MAAGSRSTWAIRVPALMMLPRRVVHMFNEAPKAMMRSDSAMKSAAAGDEKPPQIPRDQGLPLKRPYATADVARSAPVLSARSSTGALAPDRTAPRPARSSGR